MSIFLLGHVTPCWYSHMLTSIRDSILSWSCDPMLKFTLGHVFPFQYSHFVSYCCVDIHTYFSIPLLLFSLGHVAPCWYWLLVTFPMLIYSHDYVSSGYLLHLVMYIGVDIHTYSYIPKLISTLGHVSNFWYSHFVKDFRVAHVLPCWYSHFFSCWYSQ